MATAIAPLSLFELSTLPHVHLSSMHLCCCRYVSIACMANPPPQFQSTHGRGRIQATPLANMRHQQDVREGTLANMRNQRINKCTVQHKTLSEETRSPNHINRRQKKNRNIFTSVRSSRQCIALSRICNGRFCCFHFQLCRMFKHEAQLALQQQYTTQLNLGTSSSSSSMMFQNGIMTKDAGP